MVGVCTGLRKNIEACPSSSLPPSPPPSPTHRGSAESNHLGHGDEESVKTPKLVAGLSKEKIIQVAVGLQHTLVLAESGNLYGWGKNSSGEIDGSGHTIPVPKLLPMGSKKGVVYITCGAQEVRVIAKGINSISLILCFITN